MAVYPYTSSISHIINALVRFKGKKKILCTKEVQLLKLNTCMVLVIVGQRNTNISKTERREEKENTVKLKKIHWIERKRKTRIINSEIMMSQIVTVAQMTQRERKDRKREEEKRMTILIIMKQLNIINIGENIGTVVAVIRNTEKEESIERKRKCL